MTTVEPSDLTRTLERIQQLLDAANIPASAEEVRAALRRGGLWIVPQDDLEIAQEALEYAWVMQQANLANEVPIEDVEVALRNLKTLATATPERDDEE